MRILVIDTNILIDYVNGYAEWLHFALRSHPQKIKLILPTIVIAEYFTSKTLEDEKEVLIADKTFSLFAKQDLNEDIAKILGKILRHKSYLPTADLADLIVASTAIFLNAELATRNRKDFQKIPHLRFFEEKSLSLNRKRN